MSNPVRPNLSNEIFINPYNKIRFFCCIMLCMIYFNYIFFDAVDVSGNFLLTTMSILDKEIVCNILKLWQVLFMLMREVSQTHVLNMIHRAL